MNLPSRMVGSLFSSKRCTLPREPPLPTLNFTADGSLKYASIQSLYKGIFTGFNVIIQAEMDMISLYTKGYFGKGSLSHSYPSHRKRLQRILEATNLTEESNLDLVRTSQVYGIVDKTTGDLTVGTSDVTSDDSGSTGILDPHTTHVPSLDESVKEELHLTLEEAFFLLYALNCLQIFNGDQLLNPHTAWSLFEAVQTNFVERYVAYHHFRSKGWVVRSGIKYGADYVLYKDGPPFYHATFVVFISNDKTDVNFYLTCFRAVEVTKKELLLCHVKIPEKIDLNRLNECQVSEYTFKRWVPAENRNALTKS